MASIAFRRPPCLRKVAAFACVSLVASLTLPSAPVLAAAAQNPSFLALHPTLPVLYAVSEVGDTGGKPTGEIISFAIDEETGRLTLKNRQPSGGTSPCHLSVDRTGRVVLAANFGSGSVICLGLEADGSLKPVVEGMPGSFIQHESEADSPQQKPVPRGHSIHPAPDGRFALACDLGLDKVFVHSLDVGKATLATHRFAATKTGAGPRHFALHPSGRFLLAGWQNSNTLTVFAIDQTSGKLCLTGHALDVPTPVCIRFRPAPDTSARTNTR